MYMVNVRLGVRLSAVRLPMAKSLMLAVSSECFSEIFQNCLMMVSAKLDTFVPVSVTLTSLKVIGVVET